MCRDENKKVVRKAQAEHDLKNENYGPRLQVALNKVAIRLGSSSVRTAIEYQGILFFFKHYISTRKVKSTEEPDAALSRFCSPGPYSELIFDAATSVGLAALSNARNDSSLMVYARSRYGSVIRATSAVLQKPEADAFRRMFKVATLLGLFEVHPSSEYYSGFIG